MKWACPYFVFLINWPCELSFGVSSHLCCSCTWSWAHSQIPILNVLLQAIISILFHWVTLLYEEMMSGEGIDRLDTIVTWPCQNFPIIIIAIIKPVPRPVHLRLVNTRWHSSVALPQTDMQYPLQLWPHVFVQHVLCLFVQDIWMCLGGGSTNRLDHFLQHHKPQSVEMNETDHASLKRISMTEQTPRTDEGNEVWWNPGTS